MKYLRNVNTTSSGPIDSLPSGLSSSSSLKLGQSSSMKALNKGTSTREVAYKRRLKKAQCESWSSSRLAVAHFVLTERFDKCIAMLAVLQLVLVVRETDIETSDAEVPTWLIVVGNIFLAFYVLELATNLFVWRYAFFASRMNICDFVLVCADLFTLLFSKILGNLPSVSVLRLVRLVRIFRASRIMLQFRELYFMVHGLAYAMKAVAWAVVILFLLLTLWSIVAVQLLQPLLSELVDSGVLCTTCGHAFQTVMQSNLTFFQTVVAGDSWGAIAVPLIEHHPWTAIIFCSIVISVNLGVMNLVLSVIVDSAMDAREQDLQYRLLDKANSYQSSVAQLSVLCRDLDEDKSGNLSKQELIDGYENNMDFRDLIDAMDADKDDLDVLFEVLDADHSGTVSYKEFVNQLHKMKTQDAQTLLVFIRCHLSHIRHDVEAELHIIKDEILATLRSDHKVLERLDASDVLASMNNMETTQQILDPNSDAVLLQKGLPNFSESKLQPLAESVPSRLSDVDQHLDASLDIMLQDALKKVEDQTAALHLNCKLIYSLNNSLTKVLSHGSSSLSESPRQGCSSLSESHKQGANSARHGMPPASMYDSNTGEHNRQRLSAGNEFACAVSGQTLCMI